MINKLENSQRIKELNPINTLLEIGMESTSTFCDIGAGTGIFSIAASSITNNKIYAVDPSLEMQDYLKVKQQELNIKNISLLNDTTLVENNSSDFVLMCTVLHEIKDMDFIIKEIERLINKNGSLVVIEFMKQITPMGPPLKTRLSEEFVIELVEKYQFKLEKRFILGENLYCLVFKST